MDELLSAAMALLPQPASHQQSKSTKAAAGLVRKDANTCKYGPQPTAYDLAASAQTQLELLIPEANHILGRWERGWVPTQGTFKGLRDKGTTAVRLWQQASACALTKVAAQAVNETLIPLAEEATAALQRAAHVATQAARVTEQLVERAHAAEEACRSLESRAKDAASKWEREVPTEEHIAALRQEHERVRACVEEVCCSPGVQQASVVTLIEKLKKHKAKASKAVQVRHMHIAHQSAYTPNGYTALAALRRNSTIFNALLARALLLWNLTRPTKIVV